MLTIRKEQIAVWQSAISEDFIDRACGYFRRRWTGKCSEMSDRQLDAMIRAARDRAESYGIEVQRDVVRFMEVWLFLGADFDRSPDHPWAARILEDEERQGTVKIEQLVRATERRLDTSDETGTAE